MFLFLLLLLSCDNASTIALANNPINHARTKHIEIDCHFVRDKIKNGQVKPCYVPTRLQLADILTKGLSKVLHYGCLSKLGICDPYTMPTCGGGIKEDMELLYQTLLQEQIKKKVQTHHKYRASRD